VTGEQVTQSKRHPSKNASINNKKSDYFKTKNTKTFLETDMKI
jgi:hypothetical protein